MKTTRRGFLAAGTLAGWAVGRPVQEGPADPTELRSGAEDRSYWLNVLDRLAEPVLYHLAAGQLKARLPVTGERAEFAPLEAFGRLLCGIAPWLELGEDGSAEGRRRRLRADQARQALAMAVDPDSPDFMNFTHGRQPLVDAAFLAEAILRAPVQLWQNLDAITQRNLVAALRSTRRIQPYYSNWLLFSAMIEALFCKLGLDWDPLRIDLVLRTVEGWYLGDGVYGDGPEFRWDYYNSFVIQPFVLEILQTVQTEGSDFRPRYERALRIARRYAAIQERLVAPDGSYPPIGRSITYRFGAFHLLAWAAWRNELPPELSPPQVRSALTAVMRRQIEAPGTFDDNGWLRIGFAGHQPALGEGYINVGSCYLCAAGLLPLGLPAAHPFWERPGEPWTSLRIWRGEDLPRDKALDL
ncbi:MAG: DUF2264 domain-containing protein [Acidobacteriota bacterium]